MKGKMIVIGLCLSSDAKLYNHFYNTVQTFIRLDWRWTDRQPSLVCALPTPSFYACWSLSNFLIPFATFPLLTCIAYTAQDLAGSHVTQNTLTAWPLSFLLIIIFFSEKACRFPLVGQSSPFNVWRSPSRCQTPFPRGPWRWFPSVSSLNFAAVAWALTSWCFRPRAEPISCAGDGTSLGSLPQIA